MRLTELYLPAETFLASTSRPPLQVNESLQIPVVGGKGTSAYLAHSYPTKVPPESIEPYLTHHTRRGDVVLDPFCGSGMTGVAARRLGRRAVLRDLSVGAVHLATNMTRDVDASRLVSAAETVLKSLERSYSSWYGTTGRDGARARIEWTLWSETYACSNCDSVTTLWDAAVDQSVGTIAPEWDCPACGRQMSKKSAQKLGAVPAWMSISDSSGRYERPPTEQDLALINDLAHRSIRDWYPKVPLGPDREMYVRCALQLHGIDEVADFWTPRNLRAVSRMWREIRSVDEW